MKILHVAESAQGGVGTYLTEILSDQARRYGEDNVRALVPAQHAAHLSGVNRRLLVTWPRRERSALSLVALVAAIRRQIAAFAPTIVHAHSSVAGGALRLIYGWLTRPPFRIVYCPHGWAFDRRSSSLKRRLLERIERDLAPSADRIVLISEHERREGLRIGIAPERLTLVLNGIHDLGSDRAARWEDDRVRVLFVGRLDSQKGFDTLLDAVAPIQDRVAVRVIGKAVAGPATAPRPHTPQVEYLGWRSLSEVATEIAAADVVAVPSRWEGFGLVALEAMRGSCAVVASNVGGLREIVVDGVTGYLIPPDNPERLMRALARHDRATWRAMGQAGRARYEATFTARRMNAELATLYADLSSPRDSPSFDPARRRMRSGKVVLLSDYIGGEGPGSGGAGHAALDSYHALRTAGADVRVVAGFGAGDGIAADRFTALGGADLRSDGVTGMLRAIYNPAAGAALASELAGADPDTTLVILHQWTRFLSPAALRAVARFPMMIYMHDYFWACPNGLYYDFREARPCTRRPMRARCLAANCDRKGRIQKLGRVARQAAKQIATASDPARRLFLHLSENAQRTAEPLLPDERHAILYNPLPLGEAPPPAPLPTYDIGYFGRLERDKGVGSLVDALAATRMTGLFVGEGSLGPLLRETAGVTHRPWQARDTMAAAMRSCGIVVLPSLWNETWGLIVPEAMVAGVPVLVSARAGSAELVRRFGGGQVFDPARPGELAAKLTAMLAAPPAPTRLRDELRAFLSPERHAARILQLAESRFGLDLREVPQAVTARAAARAPRPA